MAMPILATKLYIPPPRPHIVLRPRLIERLNEGLHCKLIFISAPAGFGKTTLVSEWLAGGARPVAWLSLEDQENDPARFLTYLVAVLQTVVATIGEGVLNALQSPQPPPEAILTTLLNDLTTIREQFVLVLDDYHMITAMPTCSSSPWMTYQSFPSRECFNTVFGRAIGYNSSEPLIQRGDKAKRKKEARYARKHWRSSHQTQLVDAGVERSPRHHLWSHRTLSSRHCTPGICLCIWNLRSYRWHHGGIHRHSRARFPEPLGVGAV